MPEVRTNPALLTKTVFSAGFLMVTIGLAGVLFALLKFLPGHSPAALIMAAFLALVTAVIWLGLRIATTTAFLSFTAGCWLISRLIIVVLFPNFVLPGDEGYFHKFVSRLVPAIASGTIPTLSNIYDFPVWLSRSFPFYLPLAALFGPNDLVAARILNVVLGAAQLIFLFYIARLLLGTRAARLTCLLLLIFPYHCINVLSYDPQIAGTFFLLLAVWMFLLLLRPAAFSTPRLVTIGLLLGLSLLFAGIQRGGIDLLLAAVMAIVILGMPLFPFYKMHRNHQIACALAVFVLWLPLRFAFNHWVASKDANALRSHTLGFMTRGWNLVAAGEYLPLYEQLDVVSPPAEKAATLEAVLVTEFAHQPVRSLVILPFIKVAKFFALGYASTAETGLSDGGYPTATLIYQSARSIYAPLILLPCAFGLLFCWQSRRLQLRLIVPVLLMVMSCAAIVLIWETSPRYSHPVQFAVLMLATVGFTRYAGRPLSLAQQAKVLAKVSAGGLALIVCWFICAACIFAAARSWKREQFLDPRLITAQVDGLPLEVEPLHPFSASWEGEITLPPATHLPAKVLLSLPQPSTSWNHVSLSLWLPDLPLRPGPEYPVTVENSVIPSAASGHISRVEIPKDGDHPRAFTLSVQPAPGETQTASPFSIAIGYALPVPDASH